MIDPKVIQYLQSTLDWNQHNHVTNRVKDDDDNDVHNDDQVIGGMVEALRPMYGTNVSVSHLQKFGTEGLQALANSVRQTILMQQQQQQQQHHQPQQQQQHVTLQVHVPHHHSHFQVNWYIGQSLLDVARGINNSGNHNNDDADETAKELLGEYFVGSCGGNMSCSTCHVYIDDESIYPLLLPSPPSLLSSSLSLSPSPSSINYNNNPTTVLNGETIMKPLVPEAEQDMLDMAYEPIEYRSRLGCQVVLTQPVIDALIKSDTSQPPKISITIPAGVIDAWN
jgi:ferredoxin